MVVRIGVAGGVAGIEGLGQFFEQLALAGCEFLGNLYIDGNPQLAPLSALLNVLKITRRLGRFQKYSA